MSEITDFATIVLVVAGGLVLALLSLRATVGLSIPGPALFLVAAAVVSDLFPDQADRLSVRSVERIAVVALIVILFDGGLSIGLRRFRVAAVPIVALGLGGTFATAGLLAVFAHAVLGFSWTTSGLLGAALAPTDPAVMFSVLGNREIGGRTGTILEGESGANDPVGIALMIGMIDLATHDNASFWVVVRELALELSIGLAVGVAGGLLLAEMQRRIALPDEGLYLVRALAGAAAIYALASVAHGSGFLAVFVAGIVLGDQRLPFKRQMEIFQNGLSTLAEIAVFVALGLTIELKAIGWASWRDGLVLALFLALVARPLVVGPLLSPARLRNGERLFVMWSGLKGAVPILLAAFALLEGVNDSRTIYELVFVVVAFSVLVQGTTVPWVAQRLGVPIRRIVPDEGRSPRRR
jgi:cell volume regulation protein A